MSDIHGAADQARGGDQRYFRPKLPEFRPLRDDGKTHYTTWLVVGYQAGDDGTRPLQGGTVFWESPNVWVVSSAGINQPVPGEANTVFARVANLGLQDATGVYVRFWWADPSLAITEANAHQINPQNLPAVTVPSLSSVVVQCPDPWIPIVENNGHECLFAEAYIPGFDDLNAPLDPVDDRHVGQKNEQLIFVAKGHIFTTVLQAINVTGFSQSLTFEVRRLQTQTLPQLVAARGKTLPHRVVPSSAALPLAVRVQEGPRFVAGPSALFVRRLLSTTLQEIDGTARDCFEPAHLTQSAAFAPWEMRNVEISGQVPFDARPGDTFTFRIVQRVGRIVAGGYTVIVIVAEH
jgi:hypothetical protein